MTSPARPGTATDSAYTPPRDDAVTQLVAHFIQGNWDSHYRAAWTKLGSPTGLKPGAKWNWAAAFFPVAWLAYRRQWLPALGVFFGGIALVFIPIVSVFSWLIVFVVMGMYGDRIVLQRAWQAADAALRQHGDTDAARRQVYAAGGTSTVALVLFLIIPAIVIIGIIAAIAIPKFASVKAKAYASVMTTDLRTLRNSEETYFADSSRYTTSLSDLKFTPTTGVLPPEITVGPKGDTYVATVRHSATALTCAVAVGTANPLGAAAEGEPLCR